MPKTKQTALAVVPDFTAEDYTSSDRPYAWLYQYKNDKFVLKLLTQKMKEKAGKLGVRTFISLFNAYCEMQAAKSGVPLDRVLEFDGQPLDNIKSGEYVGNEDGVFLLDKFGYEIMVCAHPIMPIKCLVNADTGEQMVEIAYKAKDTWEHMIFDKATIASSQKIIELATYGIQVNSKNAAFLSEYLQKIERYNNDVIKVQKSISRLGWIKDHGFSPYLQDLVFDGDVSYRNIFNSVQPCGDYEKWKAAMREVRAERAPARIVLAASFASAILELCGLLSFVVHSWGESGNGKTVLLMVAASVWANPKMGEFATSFNSTPVGLELTQGFLNSLPLCLDELQILSTMGIKNYDPLIHQLTEESGKKRGRKSGGLQKVASWRNCIITTGEGSIITGASGSGVVNRVIEFEVTDKVYSDLVGLCAIINKNYGYAGKEFVDWLKDPDNESKIVSIQRDYYQQLLQSDSTEKQALSASAILAADRVVTDLIFKDGNNLTVLDMMQIMSSKSDIDQNQRALEFIYELVASNPSHFTTAYQDSKTEVWGKVNDDCISIIKSVFEQQMTARGYNASSFLSWAKRNNLLICDKDGRRTKKMKFGGVSINTVCIKNQTDEYDWASDDEKIEELPL